MLAKILVLEMNEIDQRGVVTGRYPTARPTPVDTTNGPIGRDSCSVQGTSDRSSKSGLNFFYPLPSDEASNPGEHRFVPGCAVLMTGPGKYLFPTVRPLVLQRHVGPNESLPQKTKLAVQESRQAAKMVVSRVVERQVLES